MLGAEQQESNSQRQIWGFVFCFYISFVHLGEKHELAPVPSWYSCYCLVGFVVVCGAGN